MNLYLDHFVLAAPDLDQAKTQFADLSGCLPADGGAHVGLGTCNALCSFGATSYLEIIAPDPEQALEGTFGAMLAELNQLTPLHYALGTDDLAAVADTARTVGFTAGQIRDTSRRQPDGRLLRWQLMGLKGHTLAGFAPFFIDWQDSPHPAQNTPVAGQLSKFQITTTHRPLELLLAAVDGVDVQSGPSEIVVSIDTPKGTLDYTATELRGFVL